MKAMYITHWRAPRTSRRGACPHAGQRRGPVLQRTTHHGHWERRAHLRTPDFCPLSTSLSLSGSENMHCICPFTFPVFLIF